MTKIATLKAALLMFFTISFLAIQAQEDVYTIEGQVKDQSTLKKLDMAQVRVLQNGAEFDVYDCGGSGRFSFDLPLGYVYDISCSRADYVSKTIRVDTKNIPMEDRAGGFISQTDFFLFKYIEGFNLEIMKEPVGKAGFDQQKNDVVWDGDYIERQKAKIDAEFKRLEDLEKNRDKLQKEFDDLMLKGGQKMIEKKYGEAMEKFSGAKKIFPDNKEAQAKYDEAKRLFDEEQAAKDLEARYSKLLADGDKAIASKNWQLGKTLFTEASVLKPQERLPKDKLKEIDDALAAEENRVQYDKLIKDADAKFENKDYGVCIQKYEEASKLIPSEDYPRDQIVKAKALRDAMMADEAERQRMEQRYKDLMTLGERNFKDKKYEDALTNYEEASGIKPDEKQPKDRIDEINKILADLKAKQSEMDALASANADKERIEKEYQEHITKANGLFDTSKLSEARSEYEAALALKPGEKYPKARITKIDEMLAEAESAKAGKDLADANKKAEEDRLKAEELARKEKEEREAQIEAERQARMEKEMADRQAEADARAQADARNKERGKLFSEVDRSREDEVEEYYRQAAESAEKSKYTNVEQTHRDQEAFLASRNEESVSKRNDNLENVNATKDDLVNVYRDGSLVTAESQRITDDKKKQAEKNSDQYTERADQSRERNLDKVTEIKTVQSQVSENDRIRMQSISQTEQKIEKYQDMNAGYTSKGDAQRKSNIYDVDKKKEDQEKAKKEGEVVREQNIEAVTEKKDLQTSAANDALSAAEVRRETAVSNVDEKKDQQASVSDGKEVFRSQKVEEVDAQKSKTEMMALEKDAASASKAYETRQELFDKNPGHAKDAGDYPVIAGTEKLKEGVTETSYELPNKTVIERTVKIGNKVDRYKKVVSKFGIYYFKNDKPITENTWNSETLDIGE
ncbi:MAG: hypothetical protein RL220_1705 [Bacteroidota bacterium]